MDRNMLYNKDMDKYEILKQIIKENKKIVFFTGAGISVPSGIPDFRSESGLYNEKDYKGYKPEEIISHHFFMENPSLFYKFYKSKMIFPNAKPNLAHLYIADLEKDHEVIVVTQNIDGLHQKAGSTKVIELHGTIHKNKCLKCHKEYSLEEILKMGDVPYCTNCHGLIKPQVVLYEEQLIEEDIDKALEAISKADVLIIIGTSLVVYPAAGFVRYFKGKHLILINKDETSLNLNTSLFFKEDVVEVIKKLHD